MESMEKTDITGNTGTGIMDTDITGNTQNTAAAENTRTAEKIRR